MASSRDRRAPAGARHRIAVVVLGRTFALDLAVAIQAFGRRPAVFQRIRPENQSPYEIELCGKPPITSTTLGFTIGELHPMARAPSGEFTEPGARKTTADKPPRSGGRAWSAVGGSTNLRWHT